MLSPQQARRGLFIFITALVLLRFGSFWVYRHVPFPHFFFNWPIWIFLSYSPAIASLVARITQGEGIQDVSFRVRSEWCSRALVTAWLWPAASGGIVYGAAWALGLVRFEWTSTGFPYESWGPEALLGMSIHGSNPLTGFLVRLLACLLFAFVVCIQSFGEELGWRGYMLTRLFDAKVRVPVFWNGLVWGLWHIAFYVTQAPDKNSPEPRWISLFFSVAGLMASAYLLSYLRLRSGSIWPPVLANASGTAVLGLAFAGFTVGTGFWLGELYLMSFAVPVIVLVLWRRPWVVRHWPQATT